MLYHIAGWLSAFCFFVCLVGLWLQVRTIWQRKNVLGQSPTASLSLNHFAVRFFAFYAYFALGLTADPFNHYLVWPRLPAIALTLVILWEIFHDRKDTASLLTLLTCLLLTICPLCGWVGDDFVNSHVKSASHIMVLVIAVLIFQSDLHQIYVIRRSGETGAVSLKTHQTTLIKDLSTVFLGLTMGYAEGWPVLIGSGCSVLTKAAIIWHFAWVSKSSLAAYRREANT